MLDFESLQSLKLCIQTFSKGLVELNGNGTVTEDPEIAAVLADLEPKMEPLQLTIIRQIDIKPDAEFWVDAVRDERFHTLRIAAEEGVDLFQMLSRKGADACYDE